MPAWMTPLLWVLVSSPGRGCRSSTQTDSSRPAMARAEASPDTPAPITATSTLSMLRFQISDFRFQISDYRLQIADYRIMRLQISDCRFQIDLRSIIANLKSEIF